MDYFGKVLFFQRVCQMFQAFHDDIKAQVNVRGELTDPINIKNVMKKANFLMFMLFSLVLSS